MWDINTIREEAMKQSAELVSVDVEELERAATESEDPNFLLEVSWLYRQKNQIKDALRVLDKVNEEYPEGDEAELQRADIYYYGGDEQRAVGIWEEVSRSANENDSIHAKMYLSYHQRKFSDAIAQYAKLIPRHGTIAPKYFGNILIPCFIYTRQFQKAKDMCLTMLELQDSKVEYLGLLGITEEGLGNKDVAEEIYSTVLELDPYDLTTMGRLTRLRIKNFRWRKAWITFWESVRRQVDKPNPNGN